MTATDQVIEGAPPVVQLLALANGFLVSRAVQIAAELGIADLLADRARTSEDLAEATATDARSLFRLLRTLSSVGVTSEAQPGRFTLTPLGECLRTDVEGSLRPWFRLQGRIGYPALGDPLPSLRTGQPAFEQLFGASFYDYLAANPEDNAVFNEAMGEFSRQTAHAVVAAYDFGDVGRVVDVGGGQGALLTVILRAHPALRGVLFDLPSVLDGTRSMIEQHGLTERCEIVAGDFFTRVPPGADAYLLSSILDDWGKDHAVAILGNCRRAMPDHGRLLVIGSVIPPGDQPHPVKLLDFLMLIGTGGQQRTEPEYAELFTQAGLRLHRTLPIDFGQSVIEARPA
ncbi:MAG: methyltransferase [Egibacteraceae bacterium]